MAAEIDSADSNASPNWSPKNGSNTGITTTEISSGSVQVSQYAKVKLQDEKPRDTEIEYVTGYKLAIIVACVALSCFLMLLDTMIISTVS
jgi:hypothetical protein